MEETKSSTTKSSVVSSSDDDRRCCKKSKMADTDGDKDDKFSKLPDAILCSILSEFSTKETVRTSILSKQWRYVWTSVPNIDLDDYEFFHDKERRNTLDMENSFENFMNRVLHLHNVSCIQKFHLSCVRDYEQSSVSAWINTAFGDNVEEIDMHLIVSRLDLTDLSSSLFTRKKLVVLKLAHNFFLNVPKSVNFPNLKIVHFIGVHFFDSDSVKNLISGCPVLEELFIVTCAEDNVYFLCIQSSTLKKLIVEFEYECKENFEYRVVIDSPNLEFLHLTNCVPDDYSPDFLPLLVEAPLTVTQYQFASMDKFIKLFRNISNVKHLELYGVEFDLPTFPDFGNLPVSLNLTYLKVTVSDYRFDVLPFLLEMSPNLHTCYIAKNTDGKAPCECWWESPNCIPKCLLFCLEEIVITEFKDCDDEIEMVGYFLKNGRVLKKMSIEFEELDSYERFIARKKIQAFPKASPTCIYFILIFMRFFLWVVAYFTRKHRNATV